MPADEFTAAHFKALKACVEVADPGTGEIMPTAGSPEATVKLAEEGLNILLQHKLEYKDPMDQLGENDRYLLQSFIESTKAWGLHEGIVPQPKEVLRKHFEDWRQLLIERLNR